MLKLPGTLPNSVPSLGGELRALSSLGGQDTSLSTPLSNNTNNNQILQAVLQLSKTKDIASFKDVNELLNSLPTLSNQQNGPSTTPAPVPYNRIHLQNNNNQVPASFQSIITASQTAGVENNKYFQILAKDGASLKNSNVMRDILPHLTEIIKGQEVFNEKNGQQVRFKLDIHQYFDQANVPYKRLYPCFPSHMEEKDTDLLYALLGGTATERYEITQYKNF
ncbi:unnamed protein product [Ambrosiozyma monospora]|uniref:Unnamed protein product n=1 Tax=Ambrosiozyma monospora TaxID=43982 RepID=A0A9W6WJ69_AMBMO|nr:unnamed protein product [Ambrosiozyma monospora]